MNSARTTFLMTFLTVNLVAAGRALDGEAGALIAFTFASAMHGIGYWFGDKIVLRMRSARAIRPDEAPRLYRIAHIHRLDDAKLGSVRFRKLAQIKSGDRLLGAIAASATGLVSLLAGE